MSLFSYTATDYSGQKITGRMEAKDRAVLINNLRKNQLVIIAIRELKESEVRALKKSGRVKLDDLTVCFRQLAALVKAGIPLVKSLNILFAQAESPFLKEILSSLLAKIESGTSLSEAMSSYPQVFLSMHINMIRAGEVSGALETILERLALYLESSSKLNRKVKSAMMYPAVVISVALMITTGIFIFVIPQFQGMFASLGANLPLPTQIMINLSNFLRQYFVALIICGILLWVALQKVMAKPQVRVRWDRIKLDLPVAGKLIRKIVVARFARTTSTLLKSGVTILSALDIGSKTTENRTIEITLAKVINRVSKGERIGESLAENKVFSPMVVSLIAVGEETGDLGSMLDKIASFYEDEVDTAISGLTSLREPFIIVFLGGMIGTIVLSLFLPIFKITQYVGR